MAKAPVDSTPTVNERSGRRGVDATPEPEAGSPEEPSPRYALGEEIARGGMGRVVDATDTLLGRRVALKEALSEDADARRRFAREIRITARLEHPSIVPVHDAGTSREGTPFYVMRKVSGRPLEELVVEAEELATRLALVPHVLAAAQAIAHAHERGVIHRDLKPSNILVGSLGETVVIDWGLAKVVDEPDDPDEPPLIPVVSAGDSLRTRVGTVFGTPGFMSPEQLRGETVDARSDVYALGATLYYVLARRPPHAASSGDEMMAAALLGPPQPIRELAPRIPAELATILDKALSYDDRARYPHAGALVEDLQRFLTGQLVAAHQYSRRERLFRFVRRHKVPVTVSSIAVIAIAVVASLALRRVISERNRADEALDQALDRNEELIVNQAQALLATSPTAAVATIKPIATKRWREARAIGLAARAMGVVRGYPASRRTTMLALTADGTHMISMGLDGVVRRHDLANHTTTELLHLERELSARLADNDKRLVVWDHDHIGVVDLATGARRDLEATGRIRELDVRGSRVWYVDDEGAAFVRALDEPAFRKVPVAGVVKEVNAGSSQQWVAYGSDALWLQHGDEPPIKVADGAVLMMDWADDGLRLGAIVDMKTIEISIVDDVPHVTLTGNNAGRFPTALATVRDGIYTGGFGLVRKVSARKPDGIDVRVAEGAMQLMAHGYRQSLLAMSSLGTITVLGEQVAVTLVAPASSMNAIAAAPNSPYVVAAAEGVLFAWDIAPMIPEVIPIERPTGFGTVGTHQLVTQHFQKPGAWIDLVDHTSVPVELSIEPIRVIGSLHGDVMVTITNSASSRLLRRGVPGTIPIAAPFRLGFFDDHDRLLVASTTGEILIHDPPGYQPRRMFQHPALPIAITSDRAGRWLSALYVDGTIWRFDAQSQRDESIVTSSKVEWSFISKAGDVFYAEGLELKRWRVDGSIELHATLPRMMFRAFLLDDDHVLVLTDDDSGFDVRLDVPNNVTSRLAPGTRIGSMSVSGELALVLDNSGSILATDPLTSVRWVLARSNNMPFVNATMSADGGRVFAMGEDLLMWNLAPPRTPDETAVFLESLTNARAPAGAAALSWE